MPITADHIRTTFAAYTEAHPEEKDNLAFVGELLDSGADLTDRKEYRGHVTAGAVLVNGDGDVLFIKHLALGKWLVPGGHVERQDTGLLGAALRELAEETGVADGVTPVSDAPLHIDVHPIPANPAKGEDAHRHIDVRFLFRTTGDQAVRLQAEEVTACAWRPAHTLADEPLRTRVLAALR
jgi:8-oxo-dGTP pyrophosphatase MutT (NUDIX family)